MLARGMGSPDWTAGLETDKGPATSEGKKNHKAKMFLFFFYELGNKPGKLLKSGTSQFLMSTTTALRHRSYRLMVINLNDVH